MVSFESLGTVSYSHSVATMAVSLADSTQYTNVTDTQPARHRTTRTAALCSFARIQLCGKIIAKKRSFCSTLKALRYGSHSVTCNYINACLYLVSIHQMAPPQTEVANI